MRDARHFNKSLNLITLSLIAGLGLSVVFLPAHSAALYKWIDEDGQIRYSDRLPVSQSKKKHQQLNSQGVVLSTTEEARSEEELEQEAKAKRELEVQQARDAEIKAVQDEKDKVLLLTFSNENELGLAKNNRIEVLDSVIQLISKSIASTTQTLDELEASAEEIYISQGAEVPGGLAQKIEHFSRKIESRNAQLELKLDEKLKIMEQYDIDLARYRQLKLEEEE